MKVTVGRTDYRTSATVEQEFDVDHIRLLGDKEGAGASLSTSRRRTLILGDGSFDYVLVDKTPAVEAVA